MAATAERRIILNADDYGFTAGVNAGILECVAAGVVTSVSVLVNTPGFAAGMDGLRALDRAPSVGLHLNLTAGEPVLAAREIPTLVTRSGRLHRLGVLAARAFAGRVDPAEVERETRAQLARLRAAWPDVDHLDSHQHAHALPGIRGAVLGAAAADGIRWVRCEVEPPGTGRGALKRLAVLASWYAASRGAPDPPAPRVAGIGLVGGDGFLEDLLRVLDRARPGLTEVVVHPGRAGADLAALDPYVEPREAELAALLSPALRGRLRRGDLVLTDFRAA